MPDRSGHSSSNSQEVNYTINELLCDLGAIRVVRIIEAISRQTIYNIYIIYISAWPWSAAAVSYWIGKWVSGWGVWWTMPGVLRVFLALSAHKGLIKHQILGTWQLLLPSSSSSLSIASFKQGDIAMRWDFRCIMKWHGVWIIRETRAGRWRPLRHRIEPFVDERESPDSTHYSLRAVNRLGNWRPIGDTPEALCENRNPNIHMAVFNLRLMSQHSRHNRPQRDERCRRSLGA